MTKHRYDREATRRELIASARAQFAKHGYTATRTEEIARLTGLTRGALYHHFSDKKGIFRAVLEGLQDDLTGEVIQRARESAQAEEARETLVQLFGSLNPADSRVSSYRRQLARALH